MKSDKKSKVSFDFCRYTIVIGLFKWGILSTLFFVTLGYLFGFKFTSLSISFCFFSLSLATMFICGFKWLYDHGLFKISEGSVDRKLEVNKIIITIIVKGFFVLGIPVTAVALLINYLSDAWISWRMIITAYISISLAMSLMVGFKQWLQKERLEN